MTESGNNSQNGRRRPPLHAALRFVIALLLLAAMFWSVSGLAGNDYDYRTGLNNFLFAFLPTISILVLIPVFIRGTLGEKVISAVFLLLAGWFAITGWTAVIGGMFGYFQL